MIACQITLRSLPANDNVCGLLITSENSSDPDISPQWLLPAYQVRIQTMIFYLSGISSRVSKDSNYDIFPQWYLQQSK